MMFIINKCIVLRIALLLVKPCYELLNFSLFHLCIKNIPPVTLQEKYSPLCCKHSVIHSLKYANKYST